MRYRRLDDSGDHVFGAAGAFLVDSPAAVAQAVRTRLLLMTGEWFLDTQEGTAYDPKILGYGTQDTRDAELQARILGTQGVTELVSYSSSVSADRRMTVNCTINTQYGQIQLSGVF